MRIKSFMKLDAVASSCVLWYRERPQEAQQSTLCARRKVASIACSKYLGDGIVVRKVVVRPVTFSVARRTTKADATKQQDVFTFNCS